MTTRSQRTDSAKKNQSTRKPRSSEQVQPTSAVQALAVDPAILQRAIEDPHRATPAAILALQRTVGNRAVTRLIQAKLTVGPVGDKYEQEADRTAEQVGSGLVTDERMGADGLSVQRQEEEEELQMQPEEDEELQLKSAIHNPQSAIPTDGGFEVGSDFESRLASQRNGGEPLPDSTQRFMEPRFGVDFSNVRVHTDSDAVQRNREIGAQAFTHGSDVFFGAGKYAPDTTAGKRLLAHELTHVVQQAGPSVKRVQRMPSPRKMIETTGKEPHKDKTNRGFGLKDKPMSVLYKAVLAHLGTYYDYVMSTPVGSTPAEIETQVAQLHSMLDSIFEACLAYTNKHKSGAVASFCKDMMSQQALERVMISERAGELSRSTIAYVAGRPKWFQFIPENFQSFNTPTSPVDLSSATVATGGTGGQKTVPKVTTTSGYTGYFAKDMKLDEFVDPFGVGDMMKEQGIDTQDPRLAARSVAMSRLDQLLGANVIARTEFAVNNGTFGTVMEKAVGDEMRSVLGQVDLNDSTLKRLLSRLQLIDALAGQVDRHTGNYFVQRDTSGNVVKLTGIDLDMSFGDQFDISKMMKIDWYPGLSRFVDAELAERIIALQEQDLRAILDGLLAPKDVDAAVERLHKLQEYLKKLKKNKKLIQPNQWHMVTEAMLYAEGTNYLAQLSFQKDRVNKEDPRRR